MQDSRDPREQLILGDVAALVARIEARRDAEAAALRAQLRDAMAREAELRAQLARAGFEIAQLRAEAAISRSSSYVSAHELAATPTAPMASALPRPSSTPLPPASIAKQLLLRAGAVEPLLQSVLQHMTEQETATFASALQR
jgi:hypothetical protein